MNPNPQPQPNPTPAPAAQQYRAGGGHPPPPRPSKPFFNTLTHEPHSTNPDQPPLPPPPPAPAAQQWRAGGACSEGGPGGGGAKERGSGLHTFCSGWGPHRAHGRRAPLRLPYHRRGMVYGQGFRLGLKCRVWVRVQASWLEDPCLTALSLRFGACRSPICRGIFSG